MQPIPTILQKYQADKRLQPLYRPADKATNISLYGVVGSQYSFIVAAAFLERKTPMLLVAFSYEEAGYLQNDLEYLLPDHTIHFLPDSFKKPQYFLELNPDNVQQRTEIIDRLSNSHQKAEIIVTYPEALFEKVISPASLRRSKTSISRHETVDRSFLIETLLEYGFKREDFVSQPGQFAIRGGIMDVYSYGSDKPHRLEWLDEEVESIRLFNVNTQRTEKEVQRVDILPNTNTQFTAGEKVNLLTILPPETLLWISDLSSVTDKWHTCFLQAEKAAADVSGQEDEELMQFFRDQSFLKTVELTDALKGISRVEKKGQHNGISASAQDTGVTAFVRDTGVTASVRDLTPNQAGLLPELTTENERGNKPDIRIPETEITLQGKPQPIFKKNFTLFFENLLEHQQKGFENFLFVDTPKQLERFYAIMEDQRISAAFQPILCTLHEGFTDPELRLVCYTDHQVFERYHRFKTKKGFNTELAFNLKKLRDLKPGDYVTHIDHGIGRFSGLERIEINGQMQEAIRLIYKNNDLLYVGIQSLHKIARYTGKEGFEPALHKIGSDAWRNLKQRTKAKVKDIAAELIKLYAKRRAAKGFAFSPDNYLQNELEASFIYEDTPDQLKATNQVKNDMMKPFPMDRLVCGDVGFGKTEIAIRATFKAVTDGKQVAILAPTTLLTLQHYKTFNDRFSHFNVKVDYLNRFRTAKERKEVLKSVAEGKTEVIIGTHALLSKDLVFKDLGLLVVDEEQKFGVSAKEKLRSLKVNVDTLTLTATPIPRTLQFSLMAARDMSVILTPPPNRMPIQTSLHVFNEDLIKDAIHNEVNRGGQVFFVHNRVKSLPEVVTMLKGLCPNVDIAFAHGQMDPDTLEQTLVDFTECRFDVLVCTNIIETGLDIANANTMIIHNAHEFGLSDLHQLRGRVGRSNRQAYCYLISPPRSVLTVEAYKRLKTLEDFSDLGSGIQIAMRDLDIRGAGNMLGGEQSGFISEIGFETYQRILDEAIRELKENEFKEIFKEEIAENQTYVRDVQIDTDVEMLIPETYVTNTSERLSLYQELDSLETEEQITDFAEQLRDRFGKLPRQVLELFDGLRLRWLSKSLGFERIILKSNKLRCYFIENPQSAFYETPVFHAILQWGATKGVEKGISFKKNNQHFILVKDHINTLKAAQQVLTEIHNAVLQAEASVNLSS